MIGQVIAFQSAQGRRNSCQTKSWICSIWGVNVLFSSTLFNNNQDL